MSYILEALRRADAERQRGDVPGLHAQPQVIAAGDPPASPWPKAWVAGGALGLFALGGALVGWWTSGAETPPPLPVANAPCTNTCANHGASNRPVAYADHAGCPPAHYRRAAQPARAGGTHRAVTGCCSKARGARLAVARARRASGGLRGSACQGAQAV